MPESHSTLQRTRYGNPSTHRSKRPRQAKPMTHLQLREQSRVRRATYPNISTRASTTIQTVQRPQPKKATQARAKRRRPHSLRLRTNRNNIILTTRHSPGPHSTTVANSRATHASKKDAESSRESADETPSAESEESSNSPSQDAAS